MKQFFLFLLFVALPVMAHGKIEPNVEDPHTYSNFQQVKIRQSHFDWYVDFSKKQLMGTATYQLDFIDKNAKQLVLDTRDLAIIKVTGIDTEQNRFPLNFQLATDDPILGQALVISWGEQVPSKVAIDYHTTEKATGIQWLTKAQTAGNKAPFLFSQSQAIHARSWVPIQDTPAIRITYTANVKTSQRLRVVMAAKMLDDKIVDVQRFSMQQPIPPYLLAIAVGRINSKKIGPRTKIYAEPETIDAAAKEFEDTESMIQITESLYGPYAWEEYNLLILPPSFPMGGMENPRLSFITPTVIAGDKSLVSLIAHELAHSWSGNLVTNNSWNDLWLNEGITSYVENRVMEALYGKERAEMERFLSYEELKAEIKELKPVDQTIVGDFSGRDPDDAFTDLPYNKGMLMLKYLERKMGRKAFDAFIKSYFSHFRFQSVNTKQFLDYAKERLAVNKDSKNLVRALEQWLYKTEWVSDFQAPRAKPFQVVEKDAGLILAKEMEIKATPFGKWNTQQKIHFLRTLLPGVNAQQMTELDEQFKLTGTGNAEVAHVWYLMAIKNHYKKAIPALRKYISGIGRQRLILPIFKALAKDQNYSQLAREIYYANRSFYHPTVSRRIEEAVNVKKN